MSADPAEIWRRQGEALSREPGAWEFSARQLMHAANLCWESYWGAQKQIFRTSGVDQEAVREHGRFLLQQRVAFFLAGVAIDGLLKALLVKKDPAAATQANTGFYTHKLSQHAGRAGLALSGVEKDLLDRLTDVVEWVGKYPIPRWDSPKGRDRYSIDVVDQNGQIVIDAKSIPGTLGDADWMALGLLVGRLYSELGA